MENEVGHLILNTIDQLRKRKARPDLDRICHMLQRNYGLNSSIVQTELDKLIVEDRVIKVDYKGNTSYRNAAKWSKARHREYIQSMTMEIKKEPDFKPIKKGPGRPRKYPLPEGAERPPEKRGRPARKKKRLKKNYGLSLEIPEMPDSTIQEDVCVFCAHPSQNKNGILESLLCCKDCKVKAHPSCMDYTPELAARSRMGPWQCIYCKSCAVCNGSGNGETMLICDACDRGYHMGCHTPVVMEKPIGVWMCNVCNENKNKDISMHKLVIKKEVNSTNHNNIDTSGLPTPCDSPVPDDICQDWNGNIDSTTNKQYPHIVPDPKDWSIDDVEKFFLSIGFADQAPAFKEQEIDGKSLLLLKRSDVLTGLSIKLGPALKIYNHVKRLQTGLSDENINL
ncbi:zinc finger protein ubi-d4-like [Centruroides vittatus]|uniref:zinc finger protein ubi-d4-like n=1 Tax=Centruroides vittatus TaxID=120091 RepID=UPI00350F19B3